MVGELGTYRIHDARVQPGQKQVYWYHAILELRRWPTPALWLSLARADWQWKEAHLFADDLGNEWDARMDPPVAILEAMSNTVRRLRLKKIAALHPELVPPRPDVGASDRGLQDIVVEFSNIISPIANGKVASTAGVPKFARKHASSLLSAASGGQ